jgi:hypothetical protein
MTAIDQSWLDSLQCPPHPSAQEIREPDQQNKNNQQSVFFFFAGNKVIFSLK